tara:strand:- start:369 stop:668 length:300 start_codon:yes stop_codon:yes gene_type:complete
MFRKYWERSMAEISYPADWREIPAEQFEKMLLTPAQYTAMRAERLAREESAPQVGQMAPDFTLERLSAEGKRSGEMVSLSDNFSPTGGRPVGLIFGSYT